MTVDEEIPLILDNFQTKPAFESSTIRGNDGTNLGVTNNGSQRSTGRFKSKIAAAAKESFANILYKDHTLRLVYVYRSIRLEFEVNTTESSTRPYQIRFVADRYNQSLDRNFETQLQILCESASAKTTNSSLYSTVSKLLGELQNFNCSPKLRALPYVHQANRLYQSRTTAWDLPLFLMRCAATSGKSSKLCSPFPHHDGVSMNHPPSFTLRFIRDNLLSSLQTTKQQRNIIIHPTSDEQAMMEFLSCLQWTEHAQICRDHNNDDVSRVVSKGNSSSSSCNSKTLRATLHLNRDALPRFQKHHQDENTIIKAYHGTSIESAWSIMNYGLRQHRSLQKNGEMMGPGVYLSSKYDVAYFFATQNGTAKYLPTEIWRSSPCFWRLVGSTKSTRSRLLMEESRKGGLDLLCYMVVECTIFKPTTTDDKPEANIQQDDTYFVVKSPCNIHMDKIHLTFEFHQRPRLWKPAIIVVGFILVALLIWKLFRLVDETNDNTFSSRLDF
jgi:hypothetical protein